MGHKKFKKVKAAALASLHVLKAEAHLIASLKEAIEVGISSGQAKAFNPQEHLEKLKTAKAQLLNSSSI